MTNSWHNSRSSHVCVSVAVDLQVNKLKQAISQDDYVVNDSKVKGCMCMSSKQAILIDTSCAM